MAEPILMLSQKAIEHIQQTIAKHDGGSGFRLAVKQTGCSGYQYMPEVIAAPKEGDIAVENVAPFRVYVDRDAVNIVKGTYIDFVVKSFGMEQLEYDNPNADSLCGCGESFNLKESQD